MGALSLPLLGVGLGASLRAGTVPCGPKILSNTLSTTVSLDALTGFGATGATGTTGATGAAPVTRAMVSSTNAEAFLELLLPTGFLPSAFDLGGAAVGTSTERSTPGGGAVGAAGAAVGTGGAAVGAATGAAVGAAVGAGRAAGAAVGAAVDAAGGAAVRSAIAVIEGCGGLASVGTSLSSVKVIPEPNALGSASPSRISHRSGEVRHSSSPNDLERL